MTSKRFVYPAILSILFSSALGGCGGVVDAEAVGAVQGATVDVRPEGAEVGVGSKLSFSALVAGAALTSVVWSVEEAAGGTIDADGHYSAPASPGTFTVVAVSAADPAVRGTASVRVAGPIVTGVVPLERRTVFQPGIMGGIPTRTALCATLAPSGGNDSPAIQAALDTCPLGEVVKLGPGRFNLATALWIRRGVTLRGSGPRSTTLWADTGGMALAIANGWASYGGAPEVGVAADVPKGARAIQLIPGGGAQFKAGDIVQIDQLDDPSYVFRGGSLSFKRGPDSSRDPRPVSTEGYRAMGQTVEVESVAGDTLNIATPIHQRFDVAFSPQVYKPVGAPVRNAGVEDVTVTGGRNGMIWVMNAANCWISNVNSDGSTVGGTAGDPNGTDTGRGMVGAHIAIQRSYRVVVRDSFVHDATNITQGGGAYGVSIESQSSECLVENNVIYNLNKPMVLRASGGGNVIGYNYIDDAWTGAYVPMQETVIDLGHSAFPHHDLIEGNWVPNVSADNVWGNSGWSTVFRNYASGVQRRTAQIPETWLLNAIGFEGRTVQHNVVGNVLGTPGMGQVYEVTSNPLGAGQPAVYRLGHRANGTSGGGDVQLYEDPSVPGTTAATVLRHGNFDYTTNSVVWDPNVADRTLPPSLYLTAKPAFMGSNPWPWVDPTGPVKVGVLPAKQRFDSGAP